MCTNSQPSIHPLFPLYPFINLDTTRMQAQRFVNYSAPANLARSPIANFSFFLFSLSHAQVEPVFSAFLRNRPRLRASPQKALLIAQKNVECVKHEPSTKEDGNLHPHAR